MVCECCEYYDGYCTVKDKRKYVQESYCDEYKTLQQGFMYEYGNEQERQYYIKHLNPNMTKHIYTRYLDNEMNTICQKWEASEELKGE